MRDLIVRFCGILLFGLTAVTSSRAEEIVLSPMEIAPRIGSLTPAALLFADTELWWLQDSKKFEEFLRSLPSPQLANEIKASTYTFKTLPSALHAQMEVLYKGRYGTGQIIAVSESLREKLPKEWVAKVYEELARYNVSPYWYSYETRAAFENDLKHYGVQKNARKMLYQELYRLPNVSGHYLFFTKKVMESLPESWLQEILGQQRRKRFGLAATLKITKDDDLAVVAKKYASDRDDRPIERYLRNLLQSSGGKEASLPLENILPSYIRDHLNQFATRDGPNCRNCAISANQSRLDAKERYLSADATERKLFREYRFVKPNESLRSGDVIAYLDAQDEIIHAVNFVGDATFIGQKYAPIQLLFTKNGFSNHAPYLFSSRDEVDTIYSSLGAKRLLVFRKAQSKSEIISSSGQLPEGLKRPYYAELAVEKEPQLSLKNCVIKKVTAILSKLRR